MRNPLILQGFLPFFMCFVPSFPTAFFGLFSENGKFSQKIAWKTPGSRLLIFAKSPLFERLIRLFRSSFACCFSRKISLFFEKSEKTPEKRRKFAVFLPFPLLKIPFVYKLFPLFFMLCFVRIPTAFFNPFFWKRKKRRLPASIVRLFGHCAPFGIWFAFLAAAAPAYPPLASASSSMASRRKLTGRKPSLQESIADFLFFIQPS